MPPAASLSQAIGLTVENATVAADTDQVGTTLNSFITLLKAIGFDEQSAAQRTVSDWFVFLLATAQFILTTEGSGQSDPLTYITQASDVVNRTLYAALAARVAPFRITAAQETAILAAYNATWGTF